MVGGHAVDLARLEPFLAGKAGKKAGSDIPSTAGGPAGVFKRLAFIARKYPILGTFDQ